MKYVIFCEDNKVLETMQQYNLKYVGLIDIYRGKPFKGLVGSGVSAWTCLKLRYNSPEDITTATGDIESIVRKAHEMLSSGNVQVLMIRCKHGKKVGRAIAEAIHKCMKVEIIRTGKTAMLDENLYRSICYIMSVDYTIAKARSSKLK